MMESRQPRLIYVPGIKPKPPPELHRAQLWRCVLEGIRRADPAIAGEMAARPAILDLVSWSHLFYASYRDLCQDLPGIDALLRADMAAGTGDISPVLAWRHRLQTLLHRLGDQVPLLTWLLAGPATRYNLGQARRYFEDRAGESAGVRALLAGALTRAWAANERVLLMAHSLGSVIAWDTLWELHRAGQGGPVDTFLTLGSPLGNHFVRTRLRGASETGAARYPPGIHYWHNLAAIGDLTALGHRMADCYREMRTLGLVQQISDRLDLVNPFRGAEGLNVHRCYGYFVNPAVGAAIVRWWRATD